MSNEPIWVIDDKCVGCGACVKACAFGAITMVDTDAGKKAKIDLTACTLCGACVEACAFDAIEMKKEPEGEKKDLSGWQDVWVFAEQSEGEMSSVTYELLGAGRKLADDLGQKLCAVLLGENMQAQAQDLIHHGAETVYLVDNPELAHFQDEPYAMVLRKMVEAKKPNILPCGATTIGRSLISRVAVPTAAGLTADCTGLAIDPETKNLLQTRPAFGGNIMAVIETPDARPQMATVRHKVMKEAALDENLTGEIEAFDVEPEWFVSRAKRIQFVPEKEATVNIAEADIIVAGGRGVGKSENFSMLEELCEVIGAGLGASRASVDANWIPYSHQVGQTGKTVCPKLYIACGISGQVQHLVGMSSSDVIVAINKDPDAPIFKHATIGVVGDVLEIIPALTKAFRQELGK